MKKDGSIIQSLKSLSIHENGLMWKIYDKIFFRKTNKNDMDSIIGQIITFKSTSF